MTKQNLYGILIYTLCAFFPGLGMAQIPTISSFTPASGPAGTVITITGTNMSTIASENVVYFGATRALVQSATTSQLMVSCPVGATFGPITVSVNGRTAYSTKLFLPSFQNTTDEADLFSEASNLATGNNPEFVHIADIDVDGKPDLIVANTNDNTISVFRNISATGSLTADSFAPKVDFVTSRLPWAVVSGDLNGDGKPDIAVACGGGPNVLYRNITSPGSLTSNSLESDGNFGSGGGGSIIMDDLDGDGKADIAATNYGKDSIEVYRNNSTIDSIFFEKKVSFLTGADPNKLVVGDFNGDNKKDLATCNRNSNTVSVFGNVGNPGAITISSFAAKVDFITGDLATSYPNSLAVGDLDGDGKLDLAVANSNGTGLSIFKGTGNGGPITNSTFALKVDFSVVVNLPHDVCLGDMNGDGKLDIVINNYTDKLYVHRNLSTAGSITTSSFGPGIALTVGLDARSIAVGDLDGDDKPDIAVTHVRVPVGLALFRNENGMVTGINDIESLVTVFPTVVQKTLNVKGSLAKDSNLLISDMSGKLIHPAYRRHSDNHQYEIDVQSLVPGLYVLRIGRQEKAFKFIKE